MSRTQRPAPVTLIQSLAQQPGRWSFVQAVRLLQRQLTDGEQLILSADPGYGYQAGTVTGLRRNGNGWTLRCNLPALTGYQGVLPYSYQDLIHQQRLSADNPALNDFFDSFNQRSLALTFRTETRYSPVVRYEQEVLFQGAPFSQTFVRLGGIQQAPDGIPAAHLLQYLGLIGLKSADPRGLQQLLEDYFELKFEVAAEAMQQRPVVDSFRSRLDRFGRSQNRLGQGCWLGAKANLYRPKLQVRVCPRSAAELKRLRASPILARDIRHMIELYLGKPVPFELVIWCPRRYLQPPQLSRHNTGTALGRTSYLSPALQPDQCVTLDFQTAEPGEHDATA